MFNLKFYLMKEGMDMSMYYGDIFKNIIGI